TYPFSTTNLSTPLSLGLNLKTLASPSSSTPTIVATVSTCPCTKCPPMRVFALTALSRFTLLFCPRRPRLVRRRVSGETPTVNCGGEMVKVVIVRQVPFMDTESPRWASERRNEGVEIVRVVPVVGEVENLFSASWLTPIETRRAEIIKIEHPTRGDDTRAWGPPFAKHVRGKDTESPGESAYFLSVSLTSPKRTHVLKPSLFKVNRNKKSIGLSFASESGQSILHSLAKTSDVLVENYLPSTLSKYSLDYPSIHALNPSLIYTSITGYGQTGPYRNRAGYDVMVEAEMGLMHITGSRDGPPVKVGVAVTDLTTGLYASNSIMAALLARARTGKGQHLDVALSDCQVATLANIASSALISGEPDSGRWGTSHRLYKASIVPYRSFATLNGDILLGGGNDRLFGILCSKLQKPEWATDPRFNTNSVRVANRITLEGLIEAETRTRTTEEWLRLLDGSGMPYAAVNDIQATMSHEHARKMVQEIEHPTCGPMKLIDTPVKYSHSEPSIRSAPPTLGQHTDEILGDILGMSEGEIGRLKGEGVVS
ncbi:MAG: hypothetical protein Q9215_003647, partial [Flavoplaca cf. flavocitrina]